MSDTPWKNFPPHELACRCGHCALGWQSMDVYLMEYLQYVREKIGIPMPISSAVRCHAYNSRISKAKAHVVQAETSRAHSVDIVVSGTNCDILFRKFIRDGLLTGIGLKQHGPRDKRFIHADNLWPKSSRTRPIIWTYE